MGTVSLPPGWQKILHAHLCEACCFMVREFINFKASDAARLPVEPVEEVAHVPPVGDKLFEDAPKDSADSHQSEETRSQGEVSTSLIATAGEPAGQTQPASAECSTEERKRTRKKLKRQDVTLPNPRQQPDDAHGEPGVH